MMPKTAFKLDLAEAFPQLAHPPIVEAVIHWQARAQKTLSQDELRSALLEKMPGYSSCEPMQKIEVAAMFMEGDAPVVQQNQG